MMAATSRERSLAIRLTAAERRDAIVDAAMHEFALSGFDATPAAVIALRAGVSQPYLFALFGTKRNLFIAAVRRGFGRVRGTILRAAEEHSESGDALNGVRAALLSLLQERTLLLLQLQAFAACADLDVRAVTRAEFEKTSRAMAAASGGPGPVSRSLLAEQAMLGVAAAMDLSEAWS
jgi:AcrR family transcriptional regulator